MTDGARRGDSKYRSVARHRAAPRRPEATVRPRTPKQIFVSSSCSRV
jgi:hypothetical protein